MSNEPVFGPLPAERAVEVAPGAPLDIGQIAQQLRRDEQIGAPVGEAPTLLPAAELPGAEFGNADAVGIARELKLRGAVPPATEAERLRRGFEENIAQLTDDPQGELAKVRAIHRMAEEWDMEPGTIRALWPAIMRRFGESEDTDPANFFERVFVNAPIDGYLLTRRGHAWYNAMSGRITDDQALEQDKAIMLQMSFSEKETPGWWKPLVIVGEVAGQMSTGLAQGAAEGAVLAGGFAAVTAPAAAAAAAPTGGASAITVLGAAGLGWGVGFTHGNTDSMMRAEAGNLFADLMQMQVVTYRHPDTGELLLEEDAQKQGILNGPSATQVMATRQVHSMDRNAAVAVASSVGLGSAAAEFIGFNKLMRLFPGGAKLLGDSSRSAVTGRILDGTFHNMARRLTFAALTGAGTEAFTEGIQELMTGTSQQIVDNILQQQAGLDTALMDDLGARLADSVAVAGEMAIPSLIIAIPGVAMTGRALRADAKRMAEEMGIDFEQAIQEARTTEQQQRQVRIREEQARREQEKLAPEERAVRSLSELMEGIPDPITSEDINRFREEAAAELLEAEAAEAEIQQIPQPERRPEQEDQLGEVRGRIEKLEAHIRDLEAQQEEAGLAEIRGEEEDPFLTFDETARLAEALGMGEEAVRRVRAVEENLSAAEGRESMTLKAPNRDFTLEIQPNEGGYLVSRRDSESGIVTMSRQHPSKDAAILAASGMFSETGIPDGAADFRVVPEAQEQAPRRQRRRDVEQELVPTPNLGGTIGKMRDRFMAEEAAEFDKNLRRAPKPQEVPFGPRDRPITVKEAVRFGSGQYRPGRFRTLSEQQLLNFMMRGKSQAAAEAAKAVNLANRVKRAAERRHAAAVADIKKFAATPIDPELRSEMSDVVDKLDFKKMRESTRVKLEAQKEFFEANKDTISMSPEAVRRLARLEQTPARDLTVEEIEAIRDAAAHVVKKSNDLKMIRLGNREFDREQTIQKIVAELPSTEEVADAMTNNLAKRGELARMTAADAVKAVKDLGRWFTMLQDHWDLLAERVAGPRSEFFRAVYRGPKGADQRLVKTLVDGPALEADGVEIETERFETVPPTRDLKGESGFVYHATNKERAMEIAGDGELITHEPGEFTDQEVWPDGSEEPRSYWSRNAAVVEAFSPEEGEGVILRSKETNKFKAESGTGDVVTSSPVSADDIQILGKDGKWHPLSRLIRSEPPPQRTEVRQSDGVHGGQTGRMIIRRDLIHLVDKAFNDAGFGKGRDLGKWASEEVALPWDENKGFTRAERVAIWRHWRNDENRRTLVEEGWSSRIGRQGLRPGRVRKAGDIVTFTGEQWGQLIDSLTPEERSLAEALDIVYQEGKRRLDKAHKAITGFALVDEGEFYNPIDRVFGRTRKVELLDINKSFDPNTGRIMPDNSMTKERVPNHKALYINTFMDDLSRYIERTSAYSGLTLPIQEAMKVLGDKRVREVLEDRYGRSYYNELRGGLEDLVAEGYSYDIVSQALRKLRQNVSVANLSSPFVSAKQALSLPVAAQFMDMQYVMKGMAKYNLNPGELDRRHRLYSPEWEQRVQDATIHREAAEIFYSSALERRFLGKRSVRQAGMAGIRLVDKRTVGAVMTGAVDQVLDEIEEVQMGKREQLSQHITDALDMDTEQVTRLAGEEKMYAAYEFADWVVERTQPMYSPEHRSPLQRGRMGTAQAPGLGREIIKTNTLYSGWINTGFSVLRREFMRANKNGWRAKDVANLAEMVALVVVVGGAGAGLVDWLNDEVFGLIGLGRKPPRDFREARERKLVPTMAGKVLDTPAGLMFFIRDGWPVFMSTVKKGSFRAYDMENSMQSVASDIAAGLGSAVRWTDSSLPFNQRQQALESMLLGLMAVPEIMGVPGSALAEKAMRRSFD